MFMEGDINLKWTGKLMGGSLEPFSDDNALLISSNQVVCILSLQGTTDCLKVRSLLWVHSPHTLSQRLILDRE